MHQELRFRRFEQVGKNRYLGFTRHQVPDSQMQMYVRALRGQAFPGTSGTYAPIALRVVGRDSPVKGWSFVDSYYETKRQIGKARITMISSAKAKGTWGRTDMDGKTIYGPYGDLPNEYVVVAGEDTILDWSSVIIIKFAKPAAGYDPLEVAAVVGTINDRPLNLLSAKKGTMRCIKVVQEQVYLDDLVYLNAYLEYNPKGFDGKVRKGAWVTREQDVHDADGAVVGQQNVTAFEIGKEWVNGVLVAAAGTEKRKYYKTSNFSILNGLMTWEIDS